MIQRINPLKTYEACSTQFAPLSALSPPTLDSISYDNDIVIGVTASSLSYSCKVLSGTVGIVGSGFAAGGHVDTSCQTDIGVTLAMLFGQH